MNYLTLLIALLCSFAMADDWTEIHGDGVYSVAQQKDAQSRSNKLAKEIEQGQLVGLAGKTDRALGAIVRVGIINLKRRGYYAEASQLTVGWNRFSGELPRIVSNRNRNIGDFEPLSVWLALAYEVLEAKLGYQICYTLRLTDIKSINFTIPVVFSPCKYGLNEFQLHFVHDTKYRGLMPLVSYWITVIVCDVTTFGTGVFFICSPIGMLVELGFDRVIAPKLAPIIYDKACN